MDKYKLKGNFKIWYHSINDNNWELESYKNLFTINNLIDYYFLINNFKKIHYHNSMIFIMKDDIKPIWEDKENKDGGFISLKISSKVLLEKWNYILSKFISNDLFLKDNNIINGISISPKKEFNIIKIWINKDINNYKGYLNMEKMDINNTLYRKYN